MSFLADLLQDTLIVRAAQTGNRKAQFGIGLLSAIIGVAILGYFYSSPSVLVEDYVKKDISYGTVSYIETQRTRDIRVSSDSGVFDISSRLWDGHFEPHAIVDVLNKSTTATIWLASPDSRDIKGIATDSWVLDPSLGAAWDNQNNRAALSIGWGFLFLGIFVFWAC